MNGSSRKHQREMDAVRARPADHVPRLVTNHEIRLLVHGETGIGRLNNRLALLITRAVGTMWAAYLFVVIALVSLPQAWAAFVAGDTLIGIQWLSQSFLQLVLLPIIIVGQNIISAGQEARAETDHETLTALQAINVQQLEVLERQQALIEELRARVG